MGSSRVLEARSVSRPWAASSGRLLAVVINGGGTAGKSKRPADGAAAGAGADADSHGRHSGGADSDSGAGAAIWASRVARRAS